MKSGLKTKNGDETRRPRGRPKTASDADRRADIIAEARRTFHEFGYGNTTMDIVAARCKMSKQTLYRLFSSKTELFVEIIAAHGATMIALPRPPGEDLPLLDALTKIFMIDIDEEEERDREAFVQFIVRESQQFPEVAVLLRTHGIQHSRQLLADWLQVQGDRGKIHLIDASSGARMLMNMIFGAMASFPSGANDWPDRKTRNEHLMDCFDIFLNGVVCRAERQGP